MVTKRRKNSKFEKRSNPRTCRKWPLIKLVSALPCRFKILGHFRENYKVYFILVRKGEQSIQKAISRISKPLIVVVIMISSLIYEVIFTIGFTRDLCIADFCLPRCKVSIAEEKLAHERVSLSSDDLLPDDHCFIKINHPSEPLFVRFDEIQSVHSFSQIMWNVRGKDKIEELNSVHIDKDWQDWRLITPHTDDPGK